MKKQKCRTCGHRFSVQRQSVYWVDVGDVLYVMDVVDCPQCGCQIALAKRHPAVRNPRECNGRQSDQPDINIPSFLLRKHNRD